MFFYLILSEY